MRIDQMPRPQLEAVARRLNITHPHHYLLPDLRATVKARYHRTRKDHK